MQEAVANAGRPKVLIIDDEPKIRDFCATVASYAGFETVAAADGIEGAELARRVSPAYVLLDVDLPGRNGMDLLREIRAQLPETRVVMITGYASVELAVAAMKLGAYDYLPKPFKPARLLEVLGQAHETAVPPTPALPPTRMFCNIVGVSKAMQDIYTLIDKAARSDSTVLIQGDSGTGKELVARAIHVRSSRATEPFVPVDCGAIVPSLIESELFGHVAGAFTDAKTAHPGLLRSAGRGSVFLDEIGELPTSIQVKLLRALQEMEVRPVGGARAEPVSARIVAATNRDLGQAVASGKFRRDLFYRLHVVPIFLPPLRERREDIPLLVEHFIRTQSERTGRDLSVSPEALAHLMRYEWPGNVRELENAMQRAAALIDDDTIDLPHLPLILPRQNGQPQVAQATGGRLALQEASAIRLALEETAGNKREAARNLGIGIATLYRKLKKYGIEEHQALRADN